MEWFKLNNIDDLSIGENYFVAEKNRVIGFGEFDGFEISMDSELICLDEGIPDDLYFMLFEWPESPQAQPQDSADRCKHCGATDDDYVPFGPEWEKEMMRMTKKELVDMIRRRSVYGKILKIW